MSEDKQLASEVIRTINTVKTALDEGLNSQDVEVLEEKIRTSNEILEELSLYCNEIVGPDKTMKMSLNIFLKDAISVWKKKFWSVDIKGSSEATMDVECSKIKLKKTFENLILNSMEAGSSEIEIKVLKDSIVVTDNGDGITKEDSLKIKESGTTKGKGRGFGLPMVKSFVSTLGWKMELKNNTDTEGLSVILKVD
jgi:nitrogen fixation/metabolism regulation signal transduction histidine kinase